MTLYAIEINDAGLRVEVADGGSVAVAPSPGYALVVGGDLVVGRQAAERARLSPRHLDHHFWDRLDSTPLGRPFPEGLSAADLAHAHLREMWENDRPRGDAEDRGGEPDEVVIAAPGWYSARQLGLLLGISRSAGLPVAGLVDSAVAAAASAESSASGVVVVDLYLHRAAATRIDGRPESSRQRVETAEDLGLIALQERWARALATLFVRRTRFDPLHQGASEQQFYDRLPLWLRAAAENQAVTAGISSGGEEYEIELTPGEWLGPVEPLYDGIAKLARSAATDGVELILVTSRISPLPGLAEQIAAATGSECLALPADAATRGVLEHSAQIRSLGESLPFVTRLVRTGEADSGDAAPADRPPQSGRRLVPSHILHRGMAYPLGTEPFVVGLEPPRRGGGLQITDDPSGISRTHCRIHNDSEGIEVEDLSRYGTWVNGERIVGRYPLKAGDVLRVGTPGTQLTLIAVAGEAQDGGT